MKTGDGNMSLSHFPCLMKTDFVSEITRQFFPCKKKESLCFWGKETISSYEILVLYKNQTRATSSNSSPAPLVTTSGDMEVRCKRLASKLSEFIAPEHFVSTLF